MVRVLCIVALSVSLVACGGDISFPPPPQRSPVAHSISHPVVAMLGMAADEADMPWGSIIQDVLSPVPGVDWRWARAHPAFKIELMDYQGWKAVVHLTAVEKVLQATGPQHIVVTVNGAPAGQATFARAGDYDLAYPVDAAVLQSAAPVLLRLDIDPCLPADSPSEKGLSYCVLLHSVGFVRDAQ